MPSHEKPEKIKAPHYSVIIPAYNEEKGLPQTLQSLKDVMDTINFPGEIIVVDNNSNDRTAEIAKTYGTLIPFDRPVGPYTRIVLGVCTAISLYFRLSARRL